MKREFGGRKQPLSSDDGAAWCERERASNRLSEGREWRKLKNLLLCAIALLCSLLLFAHSHTLRHTHQYPSHHQIDLSELNPRYNDMEVDKAVKKLLEKYRDELEYLEESGKVRCRVTKHEMAPDEAVIRKHLESTKFKLAREYQRDYSSFLPVIKPHRTDEYVDGLLD